MFNYKPLIAAALVYCVASAAHAIPFEVAGSQFTYEVESGGVPYVNFSANSGSLGDLDEGESVDFNFGNLFVPFAIAEGTAQLSVEFSDPNTVGDPTSNGEFSLFSILIFSAGDLIWDGPVQMAYSFGGAAGGLLEVAMHNLEGLSLGSSWELWGTVTNVRSPDVSVPEPAGLALLGSGLIATALIRRRRERKAA